MAKRAHGEGTLSQNKKTGNWSCQIMIGYQPNGKRDIRTFTGKTQREVKAKRDEFLRKTEAGLLNGMDIRFDEWSAIWFEQHKENVKPTTAEGYRYTLRLLTDHFGRRKLADIMFTTLSYTFLIRIISPARIHVKTEDVAIDTFIL